MRGLSLSAVLFRPITHSVAAKPVLTLIKDSDSSLLAALFYFHLFSHA
jgi:hypothetical protein